MRDVEEAGSVRRTQDQTDELRELIFFLRKKLWIIVVITLLTTMTSGLSSYYLLSPIYQAKSEVLVNKDMPNDVSEGNNGVTLGEIDSNLKLVNTYIVIMKSPRILDIALRPFTEVPLQKLKQSIKIQQVPSSQVISIIVENGSYERAAHIANAISETFKEEIGNIMNMDNVQILTTANYGDQPAPVSPHYQLIILISFLVSLVGTSCFLLLKQHLDTSIHTEKDVNRYLQLRTLGTLSRVKRLNPERYKLGSVDVHR